MRGAPQPGFSRLMRRISARTSSNIAGRLGLPCRTFQVQNNRNVFRCQAITVSGLTITSAERLSPHSCDSPTQNKRSECAFPGPSSPSVGRTPI